MVGAVARGRRTCSAAIIRPNLKEHGGSGRKSVRHGGRAVVQASSRSQRPGQGLTRTQEA